jgi:molybdenum cofactor biosynthesis enzyme MoaA
MIAKDYHKIDKTDPSFKDQMGVRSREIESTSKYISKIPDYKKSLHDVETVQLDGGEPFYTKQCTELLEYMTEHKMFHKTISAITNGSINDHQIKLLKEFDDVFLGLSIDGINDMYHVTRSPHDWAWWNNNHDRIIEAGFTRKYNSVIHCLNVHQLPEQLEYFTRNRSVTRHAAFNFSTLVSHPHLSPNIVPINIIEDTIARLQQMDHFCEKQEELDNLHNCISHLEWNTHSRSDENVQGFRRMVEVFGPLKKINYQENLPWKI